MTYCLCKKIFNKTKQYKENTTTFVETVEWRYIDVQRPYLNEIIIPLIEQLSQNASLTVINTRTNHKITIKTGDEFVSWVATLPQNGWGTSDLLIRCIREVAEPNGDISYIVHEFSYMAVDYEEDPLLVLQIYDEASGKMIEERLYKTATNMHKYLQKNIVHSTVDTFDILYRNKRCRVNLNGIDISEYCINSATNILEINICPDGTFSIVTLKTTVDGLF